MPVPLPVLPGRRIASIDALRGLTFFVMLFVNALSGASGVPAGRAIGAAVIVALALVYRSGPDGQGWMATPPWALYCAALCTALFVPLYWLVEMRGHVRRTVLVEPAASSPLVTDLLPMILLPMILVALVHVLGLRWWPALMRDGGAIAFSLLFAAATLAVVAFLNTRHFRLKL